MDIEEQKKLELEIVAALENVANKKGIVYGELRFTVIRGKIFSWKFIEQRELKSLIKK